MTTAKHTQKNLQQIKLKIKQIKLKGVYWETWEIELMLIKISTKTETSASSCRAAGLDFLFLRGDNGATPQSETGARAAVKMLLGAPTSPVRAHGFSHASFLPTHSLWGSRSGSKYWGHSHPRGRPDWVWASDFWLVAQSWLLGALGEWTSKLETSASLPFK